MVYQGHIIIPNEQREAEPTIQEVENQMVEKFGGYSRYEGSGGWKSDSGVVTEDHVRLVVTANDSWSRPSFKSWLKIPAVFVKDSLDEDAVLIEIQEVDRELV